MNKASRPTWLMLLAVFLLALAGCGETEAPEEPVGTNTTADEAEEASPPASDSSPSPAAADDFPSGEVTIVVPYGPGGGGDTFTRIFEPYFESELGVDVTIENIPGAGAIVGSTAALNRPADGYTVLMWASPPNELNTITEETPYTAADILGLGATAPSQYIIIVNASSDWESLEDLTAALEENASGISMGGTGPYGGAGTAYLKISDALGVEPRWVPFGSTSDAKTAVLGGHLDVGLVGNDGSYVELEESGEIRILGVLADEPLGDLVEAGVPTFEEVTGQRVVEGTQRGHVIHADTPQERAQALIDAYDRAATDPGFVAEIEERMGLYEYRNSEDFTDLLRSNAEELEDLVPRLEELAE